MHCDLLVRQRSLHGRSQCEPYKSRYFWDGSSGEAGQQGEFQQSMLALQQAMLEEEEGTHRFLHTQSVLLRLPLTTAEEKLSKVMASL